MDVLIHMLGLNAEHRECWRNHYVAGSGPEPELDALVADGLVVLARSPSFLVDGDRVFIATERGKNVARAENNRRNPPPNRGRARYLAWLRLSDVWDDLTFGAYLRRKLYNDPVYGGA